MSTEPISHTSVTYVINRLSQFDPEQEQDPPAFDSGTWGIILESLKTLPLTPEQAEKTLLSLCRIGRLSAGGTATSSTHPALEAITSAIKQVVEIRDVLATITSIDDSRAKQIRRDLALDEFLQGSYLEDNFPSGDIDALDLSCARLKLLHSLEIHSHAFTLDNFSNVSSGSKQLLRALFTKLQASEILPLGVTVSDATTNHAYHTLHQSQATQALDFIKRKNFAEFLSVLRSLDAHLDAHLKVAQDRLLRFGDTNVQHQKAVLKELLQLRKQAVTTLEFLGQRELANGAKLIADLVLLHHQMIQICENSVALSFIGVIKAGKSTVVDCLIGETLSPLRVEPMTSIPVRYIHDPDAKEPTMLVPFAVKLNKVTRLILRVIQEKTLSFLQDEVRAIHLQELLAKIAAGYVYKPHYLGSVEVAEAAVMIHDLFRLAVQEVFSEELLKELPLDWSHSVDGFLTVTVRFPNAELVGRETKFSLLDTPGINEAGVEKLRLKKVITDSVEASHYVGFTVDPKMNDGDDNTQLKRLVNEVMRKRRIPTLVLVTYRDERSELASAIEETRNNVADSLLAKYPVASVFSVSAKRKLLADRMTYFLKTHGRKPLLSVLSGGRWMDGDSVPGGSRIADEFTTFAFTVLGEEEKRQAYMARSPEEISKMCENLAAHSFMQEPLNIMLTTATKNAPILASNKAIEKALGVSRRLCDYLHPFEDLKEEEALTKTKLDACVGIAMRLSEVTRDSRIEGEKYLKTWKSAIKAEAEALVTKLRTENKHVAKQEHWDLDEKELPQVVERLKHSTFIGFSQDLDDLFDTKVRELAKHTDELEVKLKKDLIQCFEPIKLGLEGDFEDFLDVPTFDIDISTASLGFNSKTVNRQVWSASVQKRGSFYKPNQISAPPPPPAPERVKELIANEMKAQATEMSSQANNLVTRYHNHRLDTFFTQSIKKLSQLGEFFSQKHSVRADGSKMQGFRLELNRAGERLKQLQKNLQK